MDKQRKKELLESYKNRMVLGGVYAITNNITNKKLICVSSDLKGSRNRFEFAQQMNSCIHPRLKDDWESFGGLSFRFDVLESLEKEENQTDSDFQDDLHSLFEIVSDGGEPDRYE